MAEQIVLMDFGEGFGRQFREQLVQAPEWVGEVNLQAARNRDKEMTS